jgi:hypothetical protein
VYPLLELNVSWLRNVLAYLVCQVVDKVMRSNKVGPKQINHVLLLLKSRYEIISCADFRKDTTCACG